MRGQRSPSLATTPSLPTDRQLPALSHDYTVRHVARDARLVLLPCLSVWGRRLVLVSHTVGIHGPQPSPSPPFPSPALSPRSSLPTTLPNRRMLKNSIGCCEPGWCRAVACWGGGGRQGGLWGFSGGPNSDYHDKGLCSVSDPPPGLLRPHALCVCVCAVHVLCLCFVGQQCWKLGAPGPTPRLPPLPPNPSLPPNPRTEPPSHPLGSTRASPRLHGCAASPRPSVPPRTGWRSG